MSVYEKRVKCTTFFVLMKKSWRKSQVKKRSFMKIKALKIILKCFSLSPKNMK